jgi:hypothetical protein
MNFELFIKNVREYQTEGVEGVMVKGRLLEVDVQGKL